MPCFKLCFKFTNYCLNLLKLLVVLIFIEHHLIQFVGFRDRDFGVVVRNVQLVPDEFIVSLKQTLVNENWYKRLGFGYVKMVPE